MRITPLLPLLPLLLAAAPRTGFGLGFRLADQDPAATARGNAFTATADNPSAIYYNPAGITQLDGLQFRSGAYGVTFDEQVHSGGDRLDSHYNPQAIPEMYLTWKPKADCPVTFGFGVFAPFGLDLKYSDDSPFRTVGIEGSLSFLTAAPVVAWQITKTLSVAAGPTINYGDVTLVRGVLAPHDQFRFQGSDTSGGGEAGIQWAPNEMNHFGITYHSATGMDFRGLSQLKISNVTSTQQGEAGFHLPQFVMAGYSFRPTPDWNFEADVDYTDWDSLNNVTLRQPSGNVVLPFDYRSSFMYEFGITRNFGTWHASAGYMYSQNSVPNQSFSPLVPDSNRNVFSIGFGRKIAQWSFDIAYQFAYGPSRTVSEGTPADGEYRFSSNAISVAIGHTF